MQDEGGERGAVDRGRAEEALVEVAAFLSEKAELFVAFHAFRDDSGRGSGPCR